MRPALDERTAPDPASGAVSFRSTSTTRTAHPATAPRLRERDFWRAVAASVLATLKPWLR
jgi:hypothetical protein